jgi:hypothetical protein
MNRKWLWAVLLSLPLAVVGAVFTHLHTRTDPEKRAPAPGDSPSVQKGYVNPITGEERPCPTSKD